MRSSIGETQIHPQESRSGVSGRSTAPRQAPAANGWREDIVIINAIRARRQRAKIIERHLSAPVTDRQALGLDRGPAQGGSMRRAEIAQAGGGLVEAYPEQVVGRHPQRGAYLHTGPESLFEEFGFVRDRRIAKWRWIMRLRISV